VPENLSSPRLRVLFAGSPDVAVPTLRALAERHDVVAVLTRPPARRRRRGSDEPSPVAVAARELGLQVLEWPTLRTPEARAAVEELDVDVAVVVAYGVLVPAALLEVPRLGWVNLHFSLLPAYRGAAPVQWAVRNGDELTGATVFRLETGMDTGPVIGAMTEVVRPRDTSGELLARLSVAGAPFVLRCLDALADGTAVLAEQPTDGVSLAPRILPADARVPWTAPALAVDRFVRSMTPAPGAWTELGGVRVKLGPVLPAWATRRGGPPEVPEGLEPGEIAVTRTGVWVGTGGGAVELGDVAPAGKSWMRASDWARGARLEPGARFDWSDDSGADAAGSAAGSGPEVSG